MLGHVGAVYQFDELILDPLTPPFTIGQKAATRSPKARDLWTEQSGGERVFARSTLYGGSIVTILAIEEGAVQVHTEEGVEGWIHEQAADVLTDDLTVQGERNRFSKGTHMQITHHNGIPLRAEPRHNADKVLDRTHLDGGQQYRRCVATGCGSTWMMARWAGHDGALYIDRLP